MTKSETSDENIIRHWRKSLKDRVMDRFYTPTYPINSHWEITFSALGWTRQTTETFWMVFCRINQSRSGEISMFEFLSYFDLDHSEYIEKCFKYFDTTGGDSVDFLEFIVSVWNICTLKNDTLTNFTFDLYDLDADGELSLPEIDRMVQELYGDAKTNPVGRDVLRDVNQFAEDRGGVLDLTSFTIYTMNHSLLLFPVFQIQRTIQKKVMGMKYWEEVERSRSEYVSANDKHVFDPRHVQILLQTYKSGGAAAILSHTGDPNVALREWFEKQDKNRSDVDEKLAQNKEEVRSRWKTVRSFFHENQLKDAVSKLKSSNAMKSQRVRDALTAKKVALESQFIRKEARNSSETKEESKSIPQNNVKKETFIAKKENEIPHSLATNTSTTPSMIRLKSQNSKTSVNCDFESDSYADMKQNTETSAKSINQPSQDSVKENRTDESVIKNTSRPSLRKEGKESENTFTSYNNDAYRKIKKSARPKSAPEGSSIGKKLNNTPRQRRPKTRRFDHRNTKKGLGRPRTPGSVVYVIAEGGGDFHRYDNENSKPSTEVRNWFGGKDT